MKTLIVIACLLGFTLIVTGLVWSLTLTTEFLQDRINAKYRRSLHR